MIRKLVKLIVVLVVIVGGIVLAWFYLDSLAKTAVEKGATYALGVNTSLGSAKVSLLKGQFVMSELEVANPPGFKTSHFLTLGTGDVAVSLNSLREEVIHLPHLTLDVIDINLEKKDGSSNYQTILSHLKGHEDKPPSSEEQKGKRYIVDKLTITKATIHTNPLGGDIAGLAKVDLPIDTIELKNVGSDTGKGVLLSDLAGVIVKAVLGAAVNKAGDLLPKDIAGDLGASLAQLKDISKIADVESLGKAVGDLGKNLGNPVKDLGDQTKGAIKGLGGLLGGQDKNSGK
jgi:uncharacterized protein involved in outer membrane biogenesis